MSLPSPNGQSNTSTQEARWPSLTGFTLPNGAKRSPDLAWVRRSRWERLSTAQREGFPPLCPDFVAELRSPSDEVNVLQEKVREYMASGAQLAWLIDPQERTVYVYRPDAPMERLDHPKALSGEPILRGWIWNAFGRRLRLLDT